ncbi:TPA: hypothetical protein QCZ00_005047 [Bacillus cereus]|nr:hypothetical protein [Bacillus cereus]
MNSRFIQKRDLKYHTRQKNNTFLFEDEETDLYCTYQFSLKYFAGDIKYKRLIQAANHEDLPGLYLV